MICKNCKQTTLEDSAFCINCGSPVQSTNDFSESTNIKKNTCTQCGNALSADSKFCTNCGASISIVNTNADSTINNLTYKKLKSSFDTIINTVKSFIQNLNKKQITSIVITLVIVIGGILGFKTLGSSPKKTVNNFCKSISNKDIEKAISYTTIDDITLTKSDYNQLFSTGKAALILELQQKLNSEFNNINLSILYMTEVSAASKYYRYNVTFKCITTNKYGDIKTKTDSINLDFQKSKGKWYISFPSLKNFDLY